MSLRRFLNGVHGLLVDGCADEDERDALEERLTSAPESHGSWEAQIRAAGGEVALS